MKKIQILVLLVLFAFVASQVVVAQEKKVVKKATTECAEKCKSTEPCEKGDKCCKVTGVKTGDCTKDAKKADCTKDAKKADCCEKDAKKTVKKVKK